MPGLYETPGNPLLINNWHKLKGLIFCLIGNYWTCAKADTYLILQVSAQQRIIYRYL